MTLLKVSLSKFTLTAFLTVFITCCGFLLNNGPDLETQVDNYYNRNLLSLKKKLVVFKNNCVGRQSAGVLKNNFLDARLAYKQLAILTEYYDINISKILNGANLVRVEEDNPDKLITPHGFQVIENDLFGKWDNKFYRSLVMELSIMLDALAELEKQPARKQMFRDDLVWDAIRSASVRLITLGITGYDSPVALLSIQESRATMKGIRELLAIFKQKISARNSALFTNTMSTLDKATIYLKNNPNFNDFNRLDFIVKYLNPFYKQLNGLRVAAAVRVPEGRYPVNFYAVSIFSDTAFNINFFSPGGGYVVTKERIELGRKLFYDTLLSGTRNRSCASCHKPERAFTDGLKTALAIDHQKSLLRNTPTLLNSALQSRQFFDSRADILENQLEEVVHNSDEMKGSFVQTVQDLKADDDYSHQFRSAYPLEKEPISGFNIANAISSYIRSLTTMNSRFDQYMRGDSGKLSSREKNGFNLFMGKAKCATCHHLPLFNGLLPPDFSETESEVLAVPQSKGTQNARLDPDEGKFLFTKAVIHKYSFKTPTLRNIQLTAPYMHNGVYTSLEEVMDFYNKGGGQGLGIAPSNQTLPFDKLNLSKKEVAHIIGFMLSLTDTTYITKPAH